MPRKKKVEELKDVPPNWIDSPQEILEYYGALPLHVGKYLEVDGRAGTVVGFKGLNMVVVYEDDVNNSPYLCHPTWRVEYNKRKRSAK